MKTFAFLLCGTAQTISGVAMDSNRLQCMGYALIAIGIVSGMTKGLFDL